MPTSRDQDLLLRMATRLGRFGAWKVDVASSTVEWSDEVCAIHDLPPGSQATLRQGVEFYAAECRQPLLDAFQACIRDGAPFDLELELVTARGRRIWVRSIGEPLRDAIGRVHQVQGAIQDISERKEESERTRALAAQLTTTLESITDGFCTFDRDWRFTYVNAEAERLLQRRRDEILGHRVWDEFPEARGTVFEHQYSRAVEENRPVKFEAHFAPLDLWLEMRAYPSPQGLAVYFLDVSARKRAAALIRRLNTELEARVRERTAELEQATQDLESFNYSVAHDLRSPLRAIDGFADALAADADSRLSPLGQRYLAAIRKGAGRMARLIDDLLAYARLNRQPLQCTRLDMRALAEEALAELDPARSAEVEIPPLPACPGDESMVRQVWCNLLSNALKFTARAPAPRIEVGHRDLGTAHEFWVRDNGAGFDMRFAGKLFRAFERLHHSDEYPGTGIGLAIVQRALQRHGGRAWAEGVEGAGATIHFTLPKASPA